MPRRVHGNFRSMLKRLPESVTDELRTLQDQTGRMLLSRALSRVPVKTGALRSGLSYSVTPKTLRLRVGLLGKVKNRKLFYGRYQEFGWRPRRANRKKKLGPIREERGSVAYRIAVLKRRQQRVPGKHFVYNMPRAEIYRPYQKLWGRALHRAAQGASDDR